MPPIGAASQSAARDIAYATVRALGLLEGLLRSMVPREPAPAVAALIMVGLQQLLAPRRAVHVIVDQTVAASKSIGVARNAAGLINAVLRRFVRDGDALRAALLDDPRCRWNFPPWWIERLRIEYPTRWQEILRVSDKAAPMTLRVNQRRSSVAGMLERLERAGIEAVPLGGQALRLARPCPVPSLPGFDDGCVSVQDAGAQLAADLLQASDGMRVLDACAAPGGKSAHLLERNDLALHALDIDAARLERVASNLDRLELAADRLIEGDARAPDTWWDGEPYDRILVDAPCTASGVVRRHPDIRWLRRDTDIAALAAQQTQILDRLWPLLRPGGKLLYATCSVFHGENEGVIERLLLDRPDARRRAIAATVGHGAPAETVDQLLPTADSARDHDGFFYALIDKPT